MTKTEIENSIEFKRLQKAVKDTMRSIAFHAFMDSEFDKEFDSRKRHRKVCEDVNVAFNAISNCFDDFDSICDTMCRDYAKGEIHHFLEQCDILKKQDPTFKVLHFLEESITGAGVMEDILDMNSDEETDEVS